MASSSLFWMPAPYTMGTAATVARANTGRRSSRKPVSFTRGSRPSDTSAGAGSFPARTSVASGRFFQTSGMMRCASQSPAATLA